MNILPILRPAVPPLPQVERHAITVHRLDVEQDDDGLVRAHKCATRPDVLAALKRQGPLSIRQLTDITGFSLPQIKNCVSNLLKRGDITAAGKHGARLFALRHRAADYASSAIIRTKT